MENRNKKAKDKKEWKYSKNTKTKILINVKWFLIISSENISNQISLTINESDFVAFFIFLILYEL